ncbi:type II toxin-antitoxin system RelE family toxin [Sciscionella marina]|uniref:type II toxin-antitoxin system RelE family toxin n=1 Tax=Sciscionella marina TaxID=508770 RepID=UPI000A312F36
MTGAAWHVVVSSAAHRDLRRLPDRIAIAIVEFITGQLADNPARLTKPLRNELADYRSARRGDYRVFVRLDEEERSVLIVRVDHRARLPWSLNR